MKKSSCRTFLIMLGLFTAFITGYFLSGMTHRPIMQISPVSQTAPVPSIPSTIATDNGIPYPIDINTADHDQLTALPGIGDATADKIIAYRTENGPFRHVSDLMNVKGIGEKKLNILLPYITTGGTSNEDISR